MYKRYRGLLTDSVLSAQTTVGRRNQRFASDAAARSRRSGQRWCRLPQQIGTDRRVKKRKRLMPRKKAVSPPRTVLSKREFIDALPDVISIGALLSRAKQSGVRISKSYAYSLLAGRKKTNSKNPAAKDGAQDALRAGSKENKSPPRATPPRRSAPAARATSPVSAPAPTDAETQFLSLAVDLGLHRSQELLDRLRSRVRTLVG